MSNILHFPIRHSSLRFNGVSTKLPVNAVQMNTKAGAKPNKAPERLGAFPSAIPRLLDPRDNALG